MALKINVQKEYSIYCEVCCVDDFIHNIDGNYRHNDTPSRYFKRNGWREIGGRTLCPNCASDIKCQKQERGST